jgi:hypothetical protein
MEFIKKNWEKVLLGVVLVGLAVAVAFLPLKIQSERQDIEGKSSIILHPNVKALAPVELGNAEALLKRSDSTLRLDFSGEHRLFNPVLWQKTPDGGKIKVQSGREVGPDALQILTNKPLYFILSFDSVVTNDSGARYAIGLERQAAEKQTDRRKRQTYASVGDKSEFFLLKDVKGPPLNPTDLIVDLADSGESVTVAKGADKPFRRVDGYTADLKYPPESRTWLNRRVGDKLAFAGDDYNIVAINETEVVLSARSGKKFTVRKAP